MRRDPPNRGRWREEVRYEDDSNGDVDTYEDEELEEYDEEWDGYEDEDELLDDQAVPSRRGSAKGAIFGLFFGVLLSVGAIFFAAASVSRASAAGGSTFNILVLGTDQRPDERGLDPGRTDSMMLVAVSRSGAGVSLVSIPRDLWVTIPGFGEGRINTAYRSGELDERGSGPVVAERAVDQALGIQVDRYAVVDMSGVRDIVNQVGGVDLDIPEAIVDPEFPTDDYGTMSLMIPPGKQHLNGELALAYARTRHQDSDFGRMARQQQVIDATIARALQPSMIWRLPSILDTVSRSVRTNVTPADAPSLAMSLASLSAPNVRRLVIGPDLVTPLSGEDGASLLQPRSGLRAAVATFLDGHS